MLGMYSGHLWTVVHSAILDLDLSESADLQGDNILLPPHLHNSRTILDPFWMAWDLSQCRRPVQGQGMQRTILCPWIFSWYMKIFSKFPKPHDLWDAELLAKSIHMAEVGVH